jgi:hypothetical protein
MVLTAPYARLISSLAHVKLLLIMNTQATSEDLFKWASMVMHINNVDIPMLDRALEEENVVIPIFRINNIQNTILRLNSACEYFLNDYLELLLREKNLLKQGFQQAHITDVNVFQILKLSSMDEQDKYFRKAVTKKVIAGDLWAAKLKAFVKLTDITPNSDKKNVDTILDRIWELRNMFAHESILSGQPLWFYNIDNRKILLDDLLDDVKYLEYCSELLNIIQFCEKHLDHIQELSWKKWKQ